MSTKTLKNWVAGEKRKPALRGKSSTKKQQTPLEKLQAARLGKKLEARYDSAQITTENRKHWSNADDRNPTQSNTPAIRQRIRIRARYEWENNCICSGMISTRSTDIIGYTAPTPQVLTEDTKLNKLIQDEWEAWSNHPYVNVHSKIKIFDEGKQVEGEQFLALNRDLEAFDKTGFELGITTLSANRVCDPSYGYGLANLNGARLYNDDGVWVDPATGWAKAYNVTNAYDDVLSLPSLTQSNNSLVDSRYVLHWFTPKRSGQFRGVSELSPSLPLFAQMRRYVLATLTAAETAAMLAGIMKTNSPIAEPTAVTEWTKTELERGTLLSLPDGWDATQFRPEQPVASFEMFIYCLAREIGRAMNVPVGVVLGDSSRYNYSSARLDYGWYDEQLRFFRKQLIIRILYPLFDEWLEELASLYSQVSTYLRNKKIKRNWQFAKRPSIDPEKDANAAKTRLSNGTSNLAMECAADGNNWQDVLAQNQKIEDEKKKLSTPVGGAANDVQSTALNGAQITSLIAIADKAMGQEYPVEAAVILVQLAFPTVNIELVKQMMTILYEAKKPVATNPNDVPPVPVDGVNGTPATVA